MIVDKLHLMFVTRIRRIQLKLIDQFFLFVFVLIIALLFCAIDPKNKNEFTLLLQQTEHF